MSRRREKRRGGRHKKTTILSTVISTRVSVAHAHCPGSRQTHLSPRSIIRSIFSYRISTHRHGNYFDYDTACRRKSFSYTRAVYIIIIIITLLCVYVFVLTHTRAYLRTRPKCAFPSTRTHTVRYVLCVLQYKKKTRNFIIKLYTYIYFFFSLLLLLF